MRTTEWTRDEINAIIREKNKAVEVAMQRLYELQTADEQATTQTVHENGHGFSAAHAKKGSYYARWVSSGRRLTGRFLEDARKIALKHSRQLVEIANRKLQEALERSQSL